MTDDPLLIDLRANRLAKGLTAVALGKRIGYSPRSILKWEKGESVPNPQSFIDWIEGLNFDIGERSLAVNHRPNRNKAATHKEPSRPVDPLVYALRKRRVAQNLAVHELAYRMGYHESTLRNSETGLSIPKLALIHDWAQALGLKLELVEQE